MRRQRFFKNAYEENFVCWGNPSVDCCKGQSATSPGSVDICVYGGTSAGVIAAYTAAMQKRWWCSLSRVIGWVVYLRED